MTESNKTRRNDDASPEKHVGKLLRSCVLLLVLIGSADANGQDGAPVEEDQVAEVASIFTAFANNLRSLETYDLLIQMESSWVSDKAPLSQTAKYVRLMFDQERQRYLTVQRETTDGWVRPNEGVQTQRVDLLTAAVSIDHVTALRLRQDIRFHSLSMEEGFSLMQHTPDIQNIGLYGFPAGFRPQGQEKRSVERRRLMAHVNKIEMDENHFSVEFQDAETIIRSISFDRQEMVPRSTKEWFTSKDGDRRMTWKEDYQFSVHQGVQLPIKLVQEKKESREYETKKVSGVSMMIVDFHWLKVNESLDDKYFIKSILDDDNLLMQLVSPPDPPLN